MKILFVNTGPPGTGSFSTIDALMKVFERHGHQVKIFYPDNNIKDKHYDDDRYILWKFPITEKNISIDSFPLMLSDPNSRSGKHPILFKDLSEEQLTLYFSVLEKTLNNVIQNFKPDVIDTQHIWSNGYAVHALGKQYFVTAHNSDQIAFLKDKRMQKFAKIIIEKTAGVFVSTEFLKEKVLSLYSIKPENIYISPNGYDQTIFRPQKVNRKKVLSQLSLNIPEDAILITCIAKISKTKGIDILLKANLYLNKDNNIHFIVFGAGDINTFLKKHPLPENCLERVHFVGHQPLDIIAQANNIAKLSVLPSRSEGFPLAILEAMGCGTPLVTSTQCGLDKISVGRSFPIKEPQLLAKAILNIVNLPKEDYQNLCKKALNTARQYNWENIALKRLSIYKSVLNLN